MMRPQFKREQISDLDLADRHVRNLFRVLPPLERSGWTSETDLASLFYKFTLDTSTEFLFGESANSQLGGRSSDDGGVLGIIEETDLAKALHTAQAYMLRRYRIQGLYMLIDGKGFREACRQVQNLADQYVDKALYPHKYTAEEKPPRNKQNFVLLDELIKETKDPIELRDQLLHMLIAGRDTTAALFSWVFLLLSRHPPIYDKLRREILTHFGDPDTETHPTTIDFTQLKSCSYLQHVIQETLRLYPSVPFNARICVQDTVLPTGGGADGTQPVAVMKGQRLLYCVYAMQRRPDIWGPDAAVFRPERWATMRPPLFAFLPFNGGPRICLGRESFLPPCFSTLANLRSSSAVTEIDRVCVMCVEQFALAQVSYVLVKFLQRYEAMESVEPEVCIKKDTGLIMSPERGVRVRLRRRRSVK